MGHTVSADFGAFIFAWERKHDVLHQQRPELNSLEFPTVERLIADHAGLRAAVVICLKVTFCKCMENHDVVQLSPANAAILLDAQ
jgi:hypothetical protein